MKLEETFEALFSFLKENEYSWEPLSPEKLLRLRQQPDAFPPLVRYFGLGEKPSSQDLEREGMAHPLAEAAALLHPAISRFGNVFIPHSHWPASSASAESYVYLGEESLKLLREVQSKMDSFVGKRVLDLGSGSGILSMEISSLAGKVLGVESSARAVSWAQAAAQGQKVKNVSFLHAWIGTLAADTAAQSIGAGQSWDFAVMNPPFALPTEGDPRPHRDGGAMGVEIPLLFLRFAARHLKPDGDVFCLSTNPIVHGRSLFFDRMDSRVWEIREKKCLNDHFNQSLYRKEKYADFGIQRVELWFLHLRKRS